ncbi:hypothetical protein EG327_005878 [Venturia inaequalis]|nr:hypothetical protein EG327_005878 [Venturia inaequalis]
MPMLTAVWLCAFAYSSLSQAHSDHDLYTQSPPQKSLSNDPLYYNDPLPLSTREHWMRLANTQVLYAHTPCPFMAFGTAIVNHTLSFLDPTHPGELICTGLNHNNHTANPILDGEIAAIENCSVILTDSRGPYKLSPQEAIQAYTDFTIYTNGEPCPMCASAIVWTGFREMVYGSSIAKLVQMGWPQIRVDSRTIFEGSWDLRRTKTAWVGSVLNNETDRVYEWQFQSHVECPKGCSRQEAGGRCLVS